MSDIDWSKAPEGATHCDCTGSFYKIDRMGSNDYTYIGKWIACALSSDFADDLLTKPESKPIYTQAMVDEGVMPLVGMECMVVNCHNTPEKCIVLYSSTTYYIVAHGYGEQHYHKNSVKFLPVDTRTDTEKSIDSLKEFNLTKCDGWEEMVIEWIKLGEFYGVTFTGDKS